MVNKIEAVLTKDQIIAASDRKTIMVDVPQWGGNVMLKEMSAKSRGWLVEQWDKKRIGVATMPTYMVALSVVDADGKQLFNIDDIESLAQKSVAAIDIISAAALKLNGMEPIAEGTDKDFTKTPSADSSSD